jgi:MFS family permease
MLLMGGSLLLLLIDSSVGMLALVLFVFVIGEMLWVPTSQAIVAGWRPRTCAARMGAFGSMGSVGFALGPFTGLQLRGAYGDNAAWFFFASVSCRRRDRSRSRRGASGGE